jgi:hypothetical protein
VVDKKTGEATDDIGSLVDILKTAEKTGEKIEESNMSEQAVTNPFKPVIIGEFHFGALDRGLFHPGLVPVASQKERANTYRRYVTDCLKSPVIVGCHWFMYQDEPLTGRIYDGENYQIGFVDIADTPYQETVEASRAVAADMYDVRASAGEAR